MPRSFVPTSRLGIVLLVLSVLACASCGSRKKLKVFPVEGSVIYDGKPVEGAVVMLYPAEEDMLPEGAQPRGVSAAGSPLWCGSGTPDSR